MKRWMKAGNKSVPVAAATAPPIPVPGTPVSVTIDPVALVNGVLDCYKNIEMCREEQKTERIKARELSNRCIAAIRADTEMFMASLESQRVERNQFVATVCEIAARENVDETSLEMCRMILAMLSETNPMKMMGRNTALLSERGLI